MNSEIKGRVIEGLSDFDLMAKFFAKALAVQCSTEEPLSIVKEWKSNNAPFGIGFDTNAIKGLVRDPLNVDGLSDLISASKGACFIPGQTAVEFWNNFSIMSKEQWNSIDANFNKVIKGVENTFAADQDIFQLKQLRTQVQDIQSSYGDRQKEKYYTDASQVWNSLLSFSSLHLIPRTDVWPCAQARASSGFPPGFVDVAEKNESNKYGDFYVWSDFIYSIEVDKFERNSSEVPALERFVFVSDDVKRDWKSLNQPHPYLRAEFSAITGGSIEFITYTEFSQLVK